MINDDGIETENKTKCESVKKKKKVGWRKKKEQLMKYEKWMCEGAIRWIKNKVGKLKKKKIGMECGKRTDY